MRLVIELFVISALLITFGILSKPYELTDTEWTVGGGIEFLEHARDSRAYYADQPEECNDFTGSVEHNKRLIAEYQSLIDWLEEMR